MNKNEDFGSTDFGLVVFLLTDPRVRLVTADPLSPNRLQFRLSPSAVCAPLAQLYLSDRANVNPRLYADRSRFLKTILHAFLRGEAVYSGATWRAT